MKNISYLVRKEIKFATYESQLKAKGSVDEKKLLEMGAKRLGGTFHEDKYYAPKGKTLAKSDELLRVRKEGEGEHFFAYKGPLMNKKARTRLVVEKPIDENEIKRLAKDFREVVKVCKKRTIYILNDVVVSVDDVDNLGEFVEFGVKKGEEEKIFEMIKALGIDSGDLTLLSYFELAVMNLTTWQRILTKMHEKFGKLSFGISSAVLTTLGVIVGVNSATASTLAVIGSIAAVAIADSLSDAMGVYAMKKTERGVSPKSALKSAFYVFAGKIVFTSIFIIPFVLSSYPTNIIASIIWGFLLLSFVNVQIAFVQRESIPKTIIKNLAIATAIIIASFAVGEAVAMLA